MSAAAGGGQECFETQVDPFSHAGEGQVVNLVIGDGEVESGGGVIRREEIVQDGEKGRQGCPLAVAEARSSGNSTVGRRVLAVWIGEWAKDVVICGR